MVSNGSLKGFPGATHEETNDPLSYMTEWSADCMIPAATEKSIHAGNAEKINVKAIFEGANGPTTYKAEQILTGRGIVCAPTCLSTVVVSPAPTSNG